MTRANWAQPDDLITYAYDDNGSLIKKHYGDINDPYDEYVYNLENRLSAFTPNGGSAITYKYNDDGIRIEKQVGSANTVKYLIDPQNHTGFAQVFVQSQAGSNNITYVIGSDVLAEVTGTSVAKYLVYDGQGSVRHHVYADSNQLIDYEYQASPSLTCDTFSYDAYGHRVDPLKDTVNTGLFYTGEQFDNNLNQYYLRARYYNPLNGTFNRIDPFSGNNQDPQSLHKYLYCHNNPVNNIDPSGESDFSLVTTLVVFAIIAILFSANIANAPGPNDVVYPDASDEMIEDAFFVVAGCLLINYVILPAARTSIRYIGRGLRAPFKGFGKGPGKWVKVKENISPRAAQYQTKITGKPVEEVYIVDGVKFDGFKNGKLIDAKGPGYKNFVENDGAFNNSWWRGREQLMNQAVNQMQAAKGIPIEWHWAEKEAFIAGQELLGTNAKGIKMVFTPVK